MTPLALLQAAHPILPLILRDAPDGEAKSALAATLKGLDAIAAHPDPLSIAVAAEQWAASILPIVEPHLPAPVQRVVLATEAFIAAISAQPVAVPDASAVDAPAPVTPAVDATPCC